MGRRLLSAHISECSPGMSCVSVECSAAFKKQENIDLVFPRSFICLSISLNPCRSAGNEPLECLVKVRRRAYPKRSTLVSFDISQAAAAAAAAGGGVSGAAPADAHAGFEYLVLDGLPVPSLPSTPSLSIPGAFPSLPSSPSLVLPAWSIPTPPDMSHFSWRWGEKRQHKSAAAEKLAQGAEENKKAAEGATGVERERMSADAVGKESGAAPPSVPAEDEASVEAAAAEAPGEVVCLAGGVADPAQGGGRVAGGEAGKDEDEDCSVQSPVKVLIARWDQASGYGEEEGRCLSSGTHILNVFGGGGGGGGVGGGGEHFNQRSYPRS